MVLICCCMINLPPIENNIQSHSAFHAVICSNLPSFYTVWPSNFYRSLTIVNRPGVL